jgi:hypothetical protein
MPSFNIKRMFDRTRKRSREKEEKEEEKEKGKKSQEIKHFLERYLQKEQLMDSSSREI